MSPCDYDPFAKVKEPLRGNRYNTRDELIRAIGQSGGEGWLGFPDLWSGQKLMELIFNSCGEFLWSPECPVSQILSPQLHVGAPGIFSDFLRSVQMLKRLWGAESNGSYRTYSNSGKSATLIPEFAMEDLPSTKLQPWFLHLQWRTCPWAEHSEDDRAVNMEHQ